MRNWSPNSARKLKKQTQTFDFHTSYSSKVTIKKWNHKVFGNIFSKIKDLKDVIETYQDDDVQSPNSTAYEKLPKMSSMDQGKS